jgi:SPP1 gp7 family putative phage head morphogenesis protein
MSSSPPLIALGDKFYLQQHRTSAARYAGDVGNDIKRELAKGMLLGESVHEMTDRLVRIGGPKGSVAVRGVEGEPGAVTEYIAEGLFRRYRWWAERIVRDQVAACYTFQSLAGYLQAREMLPDLQKRWDASIDLRTCDECAKLDGVVVPIDELFPGGIDGAPAHSCCRCRTGAWRAHWSSCERRRGFSQSSSEHFGVRGHIWSSVGDEIS